MTDLQVRNRGCIRILPLWEEVLQSKGEAGRLTEVASEIFGIEFSEINSSSSTRHKPGFLQTLDRYCRSTDLFWKALTQ